MQKNGHGFVRVWHFQMFLMLSWSSWFLPASEKIPLKHGGTIASHSCNTFQILSDSPADDLLHRHAWCEPDSLRSFKFAFYFPRAHTHFSCESFWVINCYLETLVWMLGLEQFVVSLLHFLNSYRTTAYRVSYKAVRFSVSPPEQTVILR